MKGRATLHQTDAVESIKDGKVERAAGHYWALSTVAKRSGSEGSTSLHDAMIQELVQVRATADKSGDKDLAIRALAIAYEIGSDPVSLSRLLFDALDQVKAEELLRLSCMLMSCCKPGDQLHFMGFFHKIRAEHLLSGLSAEDAQRIALNQGVAFLDLMLHLDPTLDLLRAERLKANTELQRYAAAIADLRQASPEMMRGEFICDNFLYHLRHFKHPETRKAIDRIMELPTPTQKSAEARYAAMVAMKAIDESIVFADRLAAWQPEYAIVRSLKTMADDVDRAPLVTFGRKPQGRRLIYMNLVSWGERFIEMSAKTGLPSLMSPGNLPRLAEENDLVLEFVTNASNLEQILAIPAVTKLAEIAEIKIFGFPAEIEPLQNKLPYVTFGFGSHGTIFRAQRDGADLIFLLADAIWADGSFSAIAGLVTSEKRAAFIDGLNARAAAILPSLERYRSEDGACLSIGAVQLWGLAASELMPRTRDHLYDPASQTSRYPPVRLVFQESDGLTVHAFHNLPLYVSHAAFAKIKFFQYSTPDGAFLESVLDNLDREQIVYFEEFGQVMAIEIADDDGTVSAASDMGFLDSVVKYFTENFFSERLYWNFAAGIRYPLTPPPGVPIVTAEEKAACLAGVRNLFATHPVFVDWGLERDKIRRLEFGDDATHWRLTSTEEMKAC